MGFFWEMVKKEAFLKEFGKHLRRIREEKGVSLRELELRVETLSRQKISKIELGESNPTIYTLRQLAEGLEVPLEELLKGFKK